MQECGCIEIIDDIIPEGTESFQIELRSSDPEVIIIEPSQVVIKIEDDECEFSCNTLDEEVA